MRGSSLTYFVLDLFSNFYYLDSYSSSFYLTPLLISNVLFTSSSKSKLTSVPVYGLQFVCV